MAYIVYVCNIVSNKVFYMTLQALSWPNAIIMLANLRQFHPGERIGYLRVESRFLAWCRSGSGTVTVNQESMPIFPGMWLFAPWNHRIVYQASQDEPFLLGCVHLIPEWPEGIPPYWEIRHQPEPGDRRHLNFSSLSRHQHLFERRSDLPEPEFGELRRGWGPSDDPLFLLGEYIIRCFNPEPSSVAKMRHLAGVLAEELHDKGRSGAMLEAGSNFPLALQTMLKAVELIVEEPFRLGPLLVSADCSRATCYRLFRRFLKTTPGAWAMKRKMEHAAQLLLVSLLPIGDIADRVGLRDHYYFSKLFRKHHGVSAQEYRKNRGNLPGLHREAH